MELTKIRYFLDVAETQHVTQSAKNLHISQPTLTMAIRNFEKEIGAPLFTKKGRNIELTNYGLYLRDHLKPILQELYNVPKRLKTMVDLEDETIHVNVRAAWTLITEAIICYKNQHPNAKFKIIQNFDNDLSDICITTRKYYNLPKDKLENEFVRSEKIYLAVSKNGSYSDKESISLDDVKIEDFISLVGSKQFRLICDEFCTKNNFVPKLIVESDSPTAVKNMIAANIGIGFWPAYSWGKLEDNNVKLLEISDGALQRDILFTCKHNKADNSNVDDFYNYLKSYIDNVIKNNSVVY